MPENIGNRRTFEELKIPPDNVGNKFERDTNSTVIHDGLGNSLDEEPSHLRSGILTQLMGAKGRTPTRRFMREAPSFRGTGASSTTSVQDEIDVNKETSRGPGPRNRPRVLAACNNAASVGKLNGEDYMAHLISEFSKLLRTRTGMPFAFSMKPMTEALIDETLELEGLSAIEKLLVDILNATAINASVSFSQYRTAHHRFAVFFVAPSERDPVKNKDLISALRQIIKFHAGIYSPGQVNVLLVLANAQKVIEEHLFKIGAKKVED